MTRLFLGIALLLLAPASAWSAPDLDIELPLDSQANPVYMDAYQEPGKLLYRFDALIVNRGGTLDLVRRPSGVVEQAMWPDGQPTEAQHPDEEPAADMEPLGNGAAMEFVEEETHAHFHFFTAARYELLVPGAPPRLSPKIGFCMFDSFDIPGGTSLWFQPAEPWCHESAAGTVRMGLSPGAADRYSAQREFQYVDVSGLTPGEYVLRGTANPLGHVIEADAEPDVHEETRLIPGVIASGATAATGFGAPVAIPLTATVVGPDIPARDVCQPSQSTDRCTRTAADGPVTYSAAAPPAHGTVGFDGARAVYTPAPGFAGADSFAFVATDARGLVSAPATVTVQVAPPLIGDPGPRPKLLKILGAKRVTSRKVAVRVLCRPAAASACSGRVAVTVPGRGARGSRRLAALPTGRRRTLRIRLSKKLPRGRGVIVTASVRDATGAGPAARRVVRARKLR